MRQFSFNALNAAVALEGLSGTDPVVEQPRVMADQLVLGATRQERARRVLRMAQAASRNGDVHGSFGAYW